jgi:hypothetical protein
VEKLGVCQFAVLGGVAPAKPRREGKDRLRLGNVVNFPSGLLCTNGEECAPTNTVRDGTHLFHRFHDRCLDDPARMCHFSRCGVYTRELRSHTVAEVLREVPHVGSGLRDLGSNLPQRGVHP